MSGCVSSTDGKCSGRSNSLKKNAKPPAFECEYLVGDDTCQAVKENSLSVPRAEECRNEAKDACCYSCNLRLRCDISCDFPELQRSTKETEDAQLPEFKLPSDALSGMKCGDCSCYLKPKCPRDYSCDTELWRRQDPCENFQSRIR